MQPRQQTTYQSVAPPRLLAATMIAKYSFAVALFAIVSVACAADSGAVATPEVALADDAESTATPEVAFADDAESTATPEVAFADDAEATTTTDGTVEDAATAGTTDYAGKDCDEGGDGHGYGYGKEGTEYPDVKDYSGGDDSYGWSGEKDY
jgi:hypothetical protein